MYAQRQATTPANPPVVETTVKTSLRRSLSSSIVVRTGRSRDAADMETRIRTAFRDIGRDQVPSMSREHHLHAGGSGIETRQWPFNRAAGLPDRS